MESQAVEATGRSRDWPRVPLISSWSANRAGRGKPAERCSIAAAASLVVRKQTAAGEFVRKRLLLTSRRLWPRKEPSASILADRSPYSSGSPPVPPGCVHRARLASDAPMESQSRSNWLKNQRSRIRRRLHKSKRYRNALQLAEPQAAVAAAPATLDSTGLQHLKFFSRPGSPLPARERQRREQKERPTAELHRKLNREPSRAELNSARGEKTRPLRDWSQPVCLDVSATTTPSTSAGGQGAHTSDPN